MAKFIINFSLSVANVAALPTDNATATTGRYCFAEAEEELYRDNGTTWILVANVGGGGGGGTDADAVHLSVADEFDPLAYKGALHSDDKLLIENSEDSNAKGRTSMDAMRAYMQERVIQYARTILSAYTPVTVDNTLTETSLVGTYVGPNLISNSIDPGDKVRYRAHGFYSSDVSLPTNIVFSSYFSSTRVAASPSIITGSGDTNLTWNIDITITVVVNGASGEVTVTGNLWLNETHHEIVQDLTNVSVNLAGDFVPDFRVEMTEVGVDNKVTCQAVSVEWVRP